MAAAATSIETFRRWVRSRPDNEHWELIAGVPILKAPATKGLRRITSNVEWLLRDALELRRPDLVAFQRIGLNLASVAPDYDPEPDVVVVDGGAAGDECYSDRFYLVAEVVSDSDRANVESKRDIYKRHPDCHCVLVIERDRIEISVSTLTDAGWTERRLTKPDDEFALHDFGLRCRLADLYRGTALVPRPRP